MISRILIAVLFLACFFTTSAQQKKKGKAPATTVPVAVTTDFNAYFKPVKWRSIGPFRGGRSVTATGVVGDPNTYYMGTTGGGLWKTTDMGMTWKKVLYVDDKSGGQEQEIQVP